MYHRERDVAARTARRVSVCHEMPLCDPGVTNMKTCQDHLSVSVSGPLCGGTPSVDGGLAKTHGVFGRPKDRDLEEAGIRYQMVEKDWPIWSCNPPFHC